MANNFNDDFIKSSFDRLRSQAFPRTTTAVQGAGQNIREAYQQGGIPAAAGATVRNTMVPAIGLGHDLYSSARQVTDPVGGAAGTAARTAGEAFGTFARTVATGNPTPVNFGARAPAMPARRNLDEYSGSQERQAWLNSLGNGQPSGTQLEANNARIMSPDYDVRTGGRLPAGSRAGGPQQRQVPGAPGVTRATGPDGRVTYSGQGGATDAQPGAGDPIAASFDRLREMGRGSVNSMPAANFMSAGPQASRQLSGALQAVSAVIQ